MPLQRILFGSVTEKQLINDKRLRDQGLTKRVYGNWWKRSSVCEGMSRALHVDVKEITCLTDLLLMTAIGYLSLAT